MPFKLMGKELKEIRNKISRNLPEIDLNEHEIIKFYDVAFNENNVIEEIYIGKLESLIHQKLVITTKLEEDIETVIDGFKKRFGILGQMELAAKKRIDHLKVALYDSIRGDKKCDINGSEITIGNQRFPYKIHENGIITFYEFKTDEVITKEKLNRLHNKERRNIEKLIDKLRGSRMELIFI
jgi:hypothetical protein